MSISCTASSALRPRHGLPAACAVSPWNEYWTDTRPVPARAPHDTSRPSLTCVKSATSTSLKRPARMKYALVPTSSSAVPGQIRIVPGELLALHDLLHRDRRGDVHRLAGVVPLAVAGRPFDQRVVTGDAGLLRRLRDAVDVGPERDDRLARSPRRHERRRDAGDPFLHREAVLLEDVDQVAVGLDLLEPELAVAEDLVDHLLRELRAALDVGDRLLLEGVELGIGRSRGGVLGERNGDDRRRQSRPR